VSATVGPKVVTRGRSRDGVPPIGPLVSLPAFDRGLRVHEGFGAMPRQTQRDV